MVERICQRVTYFEDEVVNAIIVMIVLETSKSPLKHPSATTNGSELKNIFENCGKPILRKSY